MLLAAQHVVGQNILNRITANMEKIGNDQFRVVFRIDEASSGSGNPLNVLIKMPGAEVGDATLQFISNPFNLALITQPYVFNNALFFQYQSQSIIDLAGWSVGETITIAVFKVNGSTGSVVLSGGEFGFNPVGPTAFWPGTSLSLGNDNLVTWPIFSTISLPVELTHFSAKAQPDQTSMLTWETATELNNSHFEVEHSLDGVTYERIGKVRGAGTTDVIQHYDFLHRSPEAGTNYYRLKQVDFDGAFEYSPVEAVNFGGERTGRAAISAYPNPGVNYVMIRQSGGKLEKPWNVEVFDIQGRLIESFIMRDDTYRLDTSEWPTGVYHIRLNNEERIEQIRFVKD